MTKTTWLLITPNKNIGFSEIDTLIKYCIQEGIEAYKNGKPQDEGVWEEIKKEAILLETPNQGEKEFIEFESNLGPLGPQASSTVEIHKTLFYESIPNKSQSENVKLIIQNDKIQVKSPYNTDFVDKARKLKGKWTGEYWRFDVKMKENVKNTLLEIYSVDGTQPYETVDLEIKEEGFDNSDVLKGPIVFQGFPVAKAYGRDSGATTEDSVFIIEGGFKSTGSVKNWYTTALDQTVIQYHGLPKSLLEKEAVKTLIQEGKVSVI